MRPLVGWPYGGDVDRGWSAYSPGSRRVALYGATTAGGRHTYREDMLHRPARPWAGELAPVVPIALLEVVGSWLVQHDADGGRTAIARQEVR